MSASANFDGYSTWISRRLVRPRLHSDPDAVARAALLLTAAASEQAGHEMTSATAFSRLPTTVQQAMYRSPSAALAFGFASHGLCVRGPFRFRSDLYWLAAQRALNGDTAALRDQRGVSFTLRLACLLEFPEATCLVLSADDESANCIFDIDWRLGLGGSSAELRKAVLDQSARLCVSREEAEELIERLASLDFLERISVTDELELSLPEAFYANLEVSLARGVEMHPGLFVPRLLTRFPRRLGFIRGTEDNEQAASELADRVPLHEAIARWAALPVSLPSTLLDSYRASGQKRALLKEVMARSCSAAARGAILALAADLDDKAVAQRFRRRIASRALSEVGGERDKAFFLILSWLSDELSLVAEFRAWPARLQLAVLWSHTDTVWQILIASGVRPDVVDRAFRRRLGRVEEEMFAADAFLADVCSPNCVNSFTVGLSSLVASMDLTELAQPEIEAKLQRMLVGASDVLPWPAAMYAGQSVGNLLGSYLQIDRIDLVLALLPRTGDSQLQTLSPGFVRGAVDYLLAKAEAGTAYFLALNVGHAVYGEFREQFLELLESDTFSRLCVSDALACQALLVTIARALATSDESVKDRAIQALGCLIADWPEELRDRDSVAFVRAFAWLSRDSKQGAVVDRFAASLKHLVGRSPDSTDVVLETALSLKQRLAAEAVSSELASVLLMARLQYGSTIPNRPRS